MGCGAVLLASLATAGVLLLCDGRKPLRPNFQLLFWNPYLIGVRAVPTLGLPSGSLAPRNWPPVKPLLTARNRYVAAHLDGAMAEQGARTRILPAFVVRMPMFSVVRYARSGRDGKPVG